MWLKETEQTGKEGWLCAWDFSGASGPRKKNATQVN